MDIKLGLLRYGKQKNLREFETYVKKNLNILNKNLKETSPMFTDISCNVISIKTKINRRSNFYIVKHTADITTVPDTAMSMLGYVITMPFFVIAVTHYYRNNLAFVNIPTGLNFSILKIHPNLINNYYKNKKILAFQDDKIKELESENYISNAKIKKRKNWCRILTYRCYKFIYNYLKSWFI